ncbi:MAG: hypothetical protein ACTSQP_22035 [Promethearchaeota archaeon]
MILKKIYDASVLINILQDIDFSKIITLWNNNPKYEQWTTSEVYDEVQKLARKKLDELIIQGKIKIFDRVPKKKLEKIELDNPKLSQADCSLFYYCKKIKNCICLTNDKPLRDYLEKFNLRKSGTLGIYKKLKNDNSFPSEEIENKFAPLMVDPRVFPSETKESR